MAAIYVKEQGALVSKKGERIAISRSGQVLLETPVIKIDNLAVIGNVQITAQALYMLIENGVDISYFSRGGRYLGHTSADASKNIFLRFEQYRCYLDPERSLHIARTIIFNKIDNQIFLLEQRMNTDHTFNAQDEIGKLAQHRETLASARTTGEIMGIEGICSNLYFKAYGRMFKGEMTFSGRTRRPPKDPVNVILSLAYTFLTKEVCQVLDSESFETYLGFVHGIRYGRKSLALDIVEEFRQPAIDRLVLLLFNKGMIGSYDFDFPEDGSVILNEDGFQKFCREYERWMTGRNSLAGDRNFRGSLRKQAGLLKKAMTQGQEYTPYCFRKEYQGRAVWPAGTDTPEQDDAAGDETRDE